MSQTRQSSPRGRWLVTTIFALGLIFLIGLFLAPRGHMPPATEPTTNPIALSEQPPRSLRVVSFNILHGQRGFDPIVADLVSLAPDVVFLQEVRSEQADDIGTRLEMKVAFRRHENYPAEGIAICSRFPLENLAAIQDRHKRTCALFADAIVDQQRLIFAAVHLQPTSTDSPERVAWSSTMRGEELELIQRERTRRGSPPIVIGGDFNQLPLGPNYETMKRSGIDALAALGNTNATFHDGWLNTRIDYFLISNAWSARSGGILQSDASDHRPIWLELAPRRPANGS